MTVLETISKIQQTDEGTARLLLELALYDAVCDEADRVGPELEAAVHKALSRQAARGLVHLAKSGSTAYDVADQLAQLVLVGKADDSGVVTPDNPQTPFWDARNAKGEFASGGLRRRIFDVIGAATRRGAEDDKLKQVGQAWAGPDADKYSRLRSLGDGLVSTNDPNARPAGTVARLIGDIGPEAQRVLEPGIRRAAYRYRGTERRPDAEAQTDAGLVSAWVSGEAGDLSPETQKRLMTLQREVNARKDSESAATAGMRGGQRTPLSPGAAALAEVQSTRGSKDQKRLAGLSTFGAASLIGQIPDRDSAAISLAAGKMPPSLGLMFDGRGRLVSEAMGFNGDHYLPFDLKNLKRLKGGSYVRTRTTGGLTDEDIYTGLMTGARHITVVSNSGVFTLEFDPDLRGGRRYSDKARQMVDRYARLVGAIGSTELMQNDVPREEQNKLRRQALIDSGAREEIVGGQKTGKLIGGHAENAKKLFQRYLKEARDRAAFMGRDDDDLRAQAEAEVKAKPQGHGNFAVQVRERLNALKAEDAKSAAKVYRLDGEGYAAAQKALQTEFPYFIRQQDFMSLQDYLDSRGLSEPGTPPKPRGGTDMGYTPRGALDSAHVGIRDSADVEGKKRKILGYAGMKDSRNDKPEKPSGASAASSGAGAEGVQEAGTTLGSPAAGGGTRSVAAVTKYLLENSRQSVNAALANSLKAVEVHSSRFAEPMVDPDGKPLGREAALGEEPDAYARWLFAKNDHSWPKVADWLINDASPKELDKTISAVQSIKSKLANAEGRGEFTDEALDTAQAQLQAIRTLKQPFRPGNDPFEEPPADAVDPQGLDVAKLEVTEDAVIEYTSREENHQAMEIATRWGQQSADPEKIRQEISDAAREYQQARDYLAQGRPEDPPFPVTEKLQNDADQLDALKENAEVAQKVASMNKAWALLRMGELLGLARGVDPFVPEQPRTTAKRDSTPSRVRYHQPGSPAARALAALHR